MSSHEERFAAYRQGFVAAAEMLAEPYPVDIFTPMDEDEVKAAVAAMNEAVTHASERLHAEWARHWSKMLLAEAEAATRDADSLADLACDRETISGG